MMVSLVFELMKSLDLVMQVGPLSYAVPLS